MPGSLAWCKPAEHGSSTVGRDGLRRRGGMELGVPSGTLVLLCLVEVSLDHCHRMRRVGVQLTHREADKVGGTVGREGNNNVAWA